MSKAISVQLKKNHKAQRNLDRYFKRIVLNLKGAGAEHIWAELELNCSVDRIEPTVYLQWFLKVISLNTHQYSSNYLVYLMMPHRLSSADKGWLVRGHCLSFLHEGNSTCKQFLDIKRLNHIYITGLRTAQSCIALHDQKHIYVACKEDRVSLM